MHKSECLARVQRADHLKSDGNLLFYYRIPDTRPKAPFQQQAREYCIQQGLQVFVEEYGEWKYFARRGIVLYQVHRSNWARERMEEWIRYYSAETNYFAEVLQAVGVEEK